jgi:branched-chain amino acid transport system permease protein
MLQQLINGIALGSVYALIALGYTMVYGVLRLINFAHGDVYMLGAFVGYYAAVWLRAGERPSLMMSAGIFLIAMAVCALIGMTIERVAYRPLRQSPRLTALITAIGVSLLLEYGGQMVFGPDFKRFPPLIQETRVLEVLPANPSEQPPSAWQVKVRNTERFRFRSRANWGVTLTNVQVIILIVSLFLMAALTFIVRRTRMGKAMRAISWDMRAASLMGINTNAVITFTFALGSALAAAAGILDAVYKPTINPLMGILPGLKAFVAAVLGGIGNIPGAMLGGMLMGLAETAVVAVGYSTYRDAIAFSILIVILLVRPRGLLGTVSGEKV